MADKAVIRTENAPAPFQGAPYSQAIASRGFVFVAGQLGWTPGETTVAGGIA
jgi:enamine deaminase RidA (YjgF/YER057c/UK114 family)